MASTFIRQADSHHSHSDNLLYRSVFICKYLPAIGLTISVLFSPRSISCVLQCSILFGILVTWLLPACQCFPWSSSLILLHLSQHCPSPRVPSHSPSQSLISLAFPRSGVAASAMPDILLLPAYFRLPQLCFMSLMALAPSPILALLVI